MLPWRRVPALIRLCACVVLCSSCNLAVGPESLADCFRDVDLSGARGLSGWSPWHDVREVAHRAYACCQPENTLQAAAAALSAGAGAIEVDVRTTADGVPVLMHDETLDRTTDTSGYVRDLPFDVLESANACPTTGGFCRIPTLSEVLAQVDRKALVVLDVKDAWTCDGVRAIALAVDSTDSWRNVAMISSIEPVLVAARDMAPELPLAYYWFGLPIGSTDPVDFVTGLGAAEIMIRTEDVLAQRDVFVSARSHGLSVMAWTANNANALHQLLETEGVSRVLSDLPVGSS